MDSDIDQPSTTDITPAIARICMPVSSTERHMVNTAAGTRTRSPNLSTKKSGSVNCLIRLM